MTKKKAKRDVAYIFILILCVVAGAISWNLYFKIYTQEDTVDIHSFPMAIGEWQARELPISKADLAILETENAFVREFENEAGEKVFLFIVYSQNNRKVSHPPEICYTGAGMEILDNQRESFTTEYYDEAIQMNRLTVEKGADQQFVYYWFKVGESFTSNYWQQQALIAIKTFLGQPASSAMIRISADVKETDKDKKAHIVKAFAKSAMPHIQKHLP